MTFFMIGNSMVEAVCVGPHGIESEPTTIRMLQSLKAEKERP
jgi:hypothetical protein